MLPDGLVETWKRAFDDDDAWPVFVTLVYDTSLKPAQVGGIR